MQHGTAGLLCLPHTNIQRRHRYTLWIYVKTAQFINRHSIRVTLRHCAYRYKTAKITFHHYKMFNFIVTHSQKNPTDNGRLGKEMVGVITVIECFFTYLYGTVAIFELHADGMANVII